MASKNRYDNVYQNFSWAVFHWEKDGNDITVGFPGWEPINVGSYEKFKKSMLEFFARIDEGTQYGES